MSILPADPRTLVRQRRATRDAITPTDGELLMRHSRAGDAAALAELLDRHAAMVWRVCRGVLHREHDAQDAFQATLLILLKRAASIRANDSAAGWLYRVALRTACDVRRARLRRREEPLDAEPAQPEVQFPPLHQRQTAAVLMEELRALPDKYQTPLILRYLEGLSRREIAEQLDTTIATVQGRLVRGKRQLRSRLVRRGVSLSVAMGVLTGARPSEAAPTSTLISSGGAIASHSVAVQQLVTQGVRSMLIAAYAKPMLVVATLTLAVASVSDVTGPENKQVDELLGAQVLRLDTSPVAPIAAEASIVLQAAPAQGDGAAENGGEGAAPDQAAPVAMAHAPATAPQQELVDSYQRLIEIARGLHETGNLAETELAAAESRYASAVARLHAARGEHDQAVRRFEQAVEQAQRRSDLLRRLDVEGEAPLSEQWDVAEQLAAAKLAMVEARLQETRQRRVDAPAGLPLPANAEQFSDNPLDDKAADSPPKTEADVDEPRDSVEQLRQKLAEAVKLAQSERQIAVHQRALVEEELRRAAEQVERQRQENEQLSAQVEQLRRQLRGRDESLGTPAPENLQSRIETAQAAETDAALAADPNYGYLLQKKTGLEVSLEALNTMAADPSGRSRQIELYQRQIADIDEQLAELRSTPADRLSTDLPGPTMPAREADTQPPAVAAEPDPDAAKVELERQRQQIEDLKGQLAAAQRDAKEARVRAEEERMLAEVQRAQSEAALRRAELERSRSLGTEASPAPIDIPSLPPQAAQIDDLRRELDELRNELRSLPWPTGGYQAAPDYQPQPAVDPIAYPPAQPPAPQYTSQSPARGTPTPAYSNAPQLFNAGVNPVTDGSRRIGVGDSLTLLVPRTVVDHYLTPEGELGSVARMIVDTQSARVDQDGQLHGLTNLPGKSPLSRSLIGLTEREALGVVRNAKPEVSSLCFSPTPADREQYPPEDYPRQPTRETRPQQPSPAELRSLPTPDTPRADESSYFQSPPALADQRLLQPGQTLLLEVTSLPGEYLSSQQGLNRTVTIEPEGTIAFGAQWGRVKVAGMTIAEAEDAIRKKIAEGVEARVDRLPQDARGADEGFPAIKEVLVQLRRESEHEQRGGGAF